MQIDSYITGLKDIITDINKIAEQAIKEKESKILGTIKTRLYQTGIDGKGRSIGQYSERTKVIKQKKGQRTSFITLRDSGDFYNSMFLEVKGIFYDVNSKIPTARKLVSVYGESILDLTIQERDAIVQAAVDLAIENEINKLGQIDHTI